MSACMTYGDAGNLYTSARKNYTRAKKPYTRARKPYMRAKKPCTRARRSRRALKPYKSTICATCLCLLIVPLSRWDVLLSEFALHVINHRSDFAHRIF